jgi:DNA modification methylase
MTLSDKFSDIANGLVFLACGDCLEILAGLPENSIDAVVTDPPYHFTARKNGAAGFMGKEWDGGDIAFRPETWAEVLRVLKPGGHMVAFGAPKNYHRLACAIEDAGFEIRDSLMWVFGTGFPKSMDVSKAIDRRLRGEMVREKIMHFVNLRGVNGKWLEENGVASGGSFIDWTVGGHAPSDRNWNIIKNALSVTAEEEALFERKVIGTNENIIRAQLSQRGIINFGGAGCADITAPATDAAKEWDGWGTALKPAYEPIVLARKPLSETTVAANVLRWGTGALNIDATRIAHNEPIKTMKAQAAGDLVYGQAGRRAETTELKEAGRWPATICHDGSQQVLDLFPHTKSGVPGVRRKAHETNAMSGRLNLTGETETGYADEGSAARFFFSAKLNDEERGAVFGSEYENAANELEKIAREWDEQDKERLAYARWFASKLRAKAPPIENAETPRFHYSAKASKADRAGSKHPTVKPVSLMQWLVRMVTPPGGTVLDPFAGSGTTGMAAAMEGFKSVLIEREEEYQNDIRNRFVLFKDDLK